MAGRSLTFAVGTTLLGLGSCTSRTQNDPGAASKAGERPPAERKARDPLIDDDPEELDEFDDLEPREEPPPEPPGFHVNEGPVDTKKPEPTKPRDARVGEGPQGGRLPQTTAKPGDSDKGG